MLPIVIFDYVKVPGKWRCRVAIVKSAGGLHANKSASWQDKLSYNNWSLRFICFVPMN